MPDARPMISTAALALCAAAMLALAGCESPPRPTNGSDPTNRVSGTGGPNARATGADSLGSVPVWPFWPVGMRLHPLTRLALDQQSGQQVIECRVEFHDADGLTSKAVGQLTLQVYADSSTPTGTAALETWNQDLRDLQLNHRQYDDVTRTYLFRLQTSQPLPAGSELRAYFLSVDGRRMNAEMRLRQ